MKLGFFTEVFCWHGILMTLPWLRAECDANCHEYNNPSPRRKCEQDQTVSHSLSHGPACHRRPLPEVAGKMHQDVNMGCSHWHLGLTPVKVFRGRDFGTVGMQLSDSTWKLMPKAAPLHVRHETSPMGWQRLLGGKSPSSDSAMSSHRNGNSGRFLYVCVSRQVWVKYSFNTAYPVISVLINWA